MSILFELRDLLGSMDAFREKEIFTAKMIMFLSVCILVYSCAAIEENIFIV